MAELDLTKIQRAVLEHMADNPAETLRGYNSVSKVHPKANIGTLAQLRSKGYVSVVGRPIFSMPHMTEYRVSICGVKRIARDRAKAGAEPEDRA